MPHAVPLCRRSCRASKGFLCLDIATQCPSSVVSTSCKRILHPQVVRHQVFSSTELNVQGMDFTQRGWSSSPGRTKNFLLSTSSRLVLGPTQPPLQWVPGILSPGVKRSGREADHPPPTSAQVKNTWIYTSTPPYVFMA
jgi:hypothetical protein